MTDLAQFIQNTSLIDSHEHLFNEAHYVEQGPDIIQDLFDNYIGADLVEAGADPEAVARLLNRTAWGQPKTVVNSTNTDLPPLVNQPDPDIRGRFNAVREAWQRCQLTGYGEAVRLIARNVYGMDEITADALESAQGRNAELRQPGQRLKILKEVGNLDSVQVDHMAWECVPDPSGPDFFFYDISWHSLCNGQLNPEIMQRKTGVEVKDLDSLREAMAAIFALNGGCAIAVKSQHAYQRTLLWQERDDDDVEKNLQKLLRGQPLTLDEQLCLGDWSLARGVEFAIQYNLPFKLHTGYHSGFGHMVIDWIRAGHLCGLLEKYPSARFVLMHIAYPYDSELIALAKHFPNVYVDMCWAWSMNPYVASNFVRSMIHSVPLNKVFGFGGDCRWPNVAVAYSIQARQWLNRALQAEIDDGLLSEAQAIDVARHLMRTNQEACFDFAGTRQAIAQAVKSQLTP